MFLGNTALQRSTVSGNLKIVKFLYENGASLKTRNKHGNFWILKQRLRHYKHIEFDF